MCNQKETCSEWITLHRIDGEEIQLNSDLIVGLVPYYQAMCPGTTIITHGGYNVVVREHISEIKELLDFDMVDVSDREKLINQIDTQADTILQQSKTIEYWMKQHDEAAKQLGAERDTCERHCQHASRLMDDNSKLTKKLTEVTDALKKVTEERDQAIIRAKNAEYDANVLRDRFCYTSQNGPSANAQRYGYSVIFSDGLSDYAKWPGTK